MALPPVSKEDPLMNPLIFYGVICLTPVHWIMTGFPKLLNFKENQEIKRRNLRRVLTRRQEHLLFSQKTAIFLQELTCCLSREGIRGIPGAFGPKIKYKIGLSGRYLDYKAERHLSYREKIKESRPFVLLQRIFGQCASRLSQRVFCSSTLNTCLENLLLKGSRRIVRHREVPGKSQYPAVMLQSLARALLLHEELDHEKQPDGLTWEEKVILRIEKLKNLEMLPCGLPDPEERRLTKENIQEELDLAMDKLLERLTDELLEMIFPDHCLHGLLKGLYKLEGRDFLNQILRGGLGALVKATTDPQQVMLTIIYAMGRETAELEKDGYGKNSLESIVNVGKKLLEGYSFDASIDQLHALFEHEVPKYRAGGRAEIAQKVETRRIFHHMISNLLHRSIKQDQFDFEETTYKAFRKATKQIPLFGELLTGVHLFTKGTLITLFSPFEEKPLFQTLFESLAGKDLANHLTKTVHNFIEKPMWQLIVIEVINETYTHLLEVRGKRPKRRKISKEIQERSCGDIALYVLRDAFPSAAPVFSGYREQLGKSIRNALQKDPSTSFKKLVKEVMHNTLPSIKEATLFFRLTNLFRMKGVQVEGDLRFWDHYIREILNRAVERKLIKGGWGLSPLDRCETPRRGQSYRERTFFEARRSWWRSRHRIELIDHLLTLKGDELVESLLKLQKPLRVERRALADWQVVNLPSPPKSPTAEVKEEGYLNIFENYMT